MSISETVTLIILQVILAVTFVTIFYYTYVNFVEKQSLIDQTRNTISQLKNELELESLVPIANINKLPKVSYTPSQEDIESDKEIQKSNSELLRRSSRMLSVILSLGFIFVIILTMEFKLNFGRILTLSLLGTLVIAFTEFIFLSVFARNYIILDSNMVENAFYKGLLDYTQQ